MQIIRQDSLIPPRWRKIPLTQGQIALVWESDYHWLIHYKWHARRQYLGTYYAFHSVNERFSISMHRLILGLTKDDFLTKGIEVDHINGNPLDNRRDNLRLATRTQNAANSALRHNKTGFRGVDFHENRGSKPFRAAIAAKHIGYFPTAEEAARAYDAKAKELYGEFAKTNY